MTLPDFLRSLETQLALRGAVYERAALQSFVADAWPLIEDDPDPARWAEKFLRAGVVVVK